MPGWMTVQALAPQRGYMSLNCVLCSTLSPQAALTPSGWGGDEGLCVADSQGLLQLLPSLLDLGVEVSAHSFLSPWLEVELGSTLLFRIPNNISHCLESTKDKAVQGVRKLCAEQNCTPFASKKLQFSQVRSLCLISVLVLLSEQEIAFLSLWELAIMREACDWIHLPHKKSFYLQVPALGLEPVIDEALRISGKAQHELTLGLQLVNCLYCFMDLVIQSSNFLLTGS